MLCDVDPQCTLFRVILNTAEIVRMPACHKAVQGGVKTGADVARVLSALITDITGNTIDARAANALNNSVGKLIKNFEVAHKHGQPSQRTKKLSGVKYVE